MFGINGGKPPASAAMQVQNIALGPDDSFFVGQLDKKTNKVTLAWGQNMQALELVNLAFAMLTAAMQVLTKAIVSPIVDAQNKPIVRVNGDSRPKDQGGTGGI
jgi:hypothetical protein